MTKLENLLLREYEFTSNEDEKAILLMRLSRTPQGFVVYCKSPLFHTFFKEIAVGKTLDIRWDQSTDDDANEEIPEGEQSKKLVRNRPYNLQKLWTSEWFDGSQSIANFNDPDDYVPKTLNQALKNYGSRIIISSIHCDPKFKWQGTPNLSFITSCDIGDGANFLFRTPISDKVFDIFYESSKTYLTWIHDNFLTPKHAEYKLTSRRKTTKEPNVLDTSVWRRGNV